MNDVAIDYGELATLAADLRMIEQELANASDRNEDLSAGVARPFDRVELSMQANRFEIDWDDRRKSILERLENLRKHVDTMAQEFKHLDTRPVYGPYQNPQPFGTCKAPAED